jgi:hypothetical protein
LAISIGLGAEDADADDDDDDDDEEEEEETSGGLGSDGALPHRSLAALEDDSTVS